MRFLSLLHAGMSLRHADGEMSSLSLSLSTSIRSSRWIKLKHWCLKENESCAQVENTSTRDLTSSDRRIRTGESGKRTRTRT